MAVKKKRKVKKNSPTGIAHIKSTFNNTIIAITDLEGAIVASASTGMKGFKGTKKGTPFAAQQTAETAALKAIEVAGMQRVHVLVKGPGSGRETAIRAIQSAGIDVESIKDVTPIPHNRCRPRKRRR